MVLPQHDTSSCEAEPAERNLCRDVQLPLENVAFAIQEYLTTPGKELDPQTRALLIGVRACVTRAADASRQIAEDPTDAKITPPETQKRWVA